MKKFDILPSNENFRGRTYGEWASEWLKKMLSANPDYYSKDDPVIFLRTNVDYSPVQGQENGYRENTTTHYGRTDDNGIEIYQGAALFFPVVEANFLTGCKNPENKNKVLQTEEELRHYARKDIDSGWEIGSFIKIDKENAQPIVNNLKDYRAESPLFKVAVSGKSPLKDKWEEVLNAGTFDAVIDGYWILIRELQASAEPYRIYFEAKNGTYYHYSATYDIFVKPRPKSNFRDKSHSLAHHYV